jgi:hypothetical protein
MQLKSMIEAYTLVDGLEINVCPSPDNTGYMVYATYPGAEEMKVQILMTQRDQERRFKTLDAVFKLFKDTPVHEFKVSTVVQYVTDFL